MLVRIFCNLKSFDLGDVIRFCCQVLGDHFVEELFRGPSDAFYFDYFVWFVLTSVDRPESALGDLISDYEDFSVDLDGCLCLDAESVGEIFE